MPDTDGSPGQPALPKLTLGQRMLAALPNLQRTGTARQRLTSALKPDAVLDPASRPRRAGTSAPAARGRFTDTYPDLSVGELRQLMKRLDDRERLIAMVAGPLIAILDLLLTQLTLHNNPPLHHKGHADPGQIVAIGVGSAVIALLVLATAFFRRRSLTLFALLFSGYGGGFVTILPAWIIAGWLFVHFSRMQRSLQAKTGGPAASRADAAKRRAERLEQRRKGKGKAPEPAGPNPNKRYTPPKPVRLPPSSG
ncbi:MAG: hypothetical protein ACYDA2_05695 [Acidimicrobiales bacterium]